MFLPMRLPQRLYKKVEVFRASVEKRVEDFGAQYQAFGVFGILNYPLFYLIWKYYGQTGYENLLLRLIAAFLSALLLFKDYWPKICKPWLPVYWYFTLMFCLPFFFFFMLFMNGIDDGIWLMTANTVLFWLGFMVEPLSYIFILSGGILFAWIVFLCWHAAPIVSFWKWWGVNVEFIASFVVAAFFASKKHQFNEKKLQAMQSLASTLAHEMRTPLASIQASISGAKNYWLDLLAAHKAAKAAQLLIPSIRPSQLTLLEKTFHRIYRETNFANTVVNMLLANANLGKLKNDSLEVFSATECITEALERYPFAEGERQIVQWEKGQDFLFRGEGILFIHTLFNLVKNSLHHIKVANKGSIRIWQSVSECYNQLHFLDTGTGISSHLLPRIFEPFFSKTHHGSGIGLTFCKAVMESFEGTIECASVEGEYTEFILSFPIIASHESFTH